MELTEQFILRQAPNPAAAENGRKLSRGGKFFGLHRSEDGSVCWGECAGSGKTPYRVSIDWANTDSPICRCSCPSRQFPCKHALGLMFEQLSGKNFETAEIPQDIVEKREKTGGESGQKGGCCARAQKAEKNQYSGAGQAVGPPAGRAGHGGKDGGGAFEYRSCQYGRQLRANL